MKVVFFNRQRDLSLLHIKRDAIFLIETIIHQEIQQTDVWDEVVVHFVSEKKICSLHDLFFLDPSTTDCITIPIDTIDSPKPRILGEIFVCPKTAITYAEKVKKDPYTETLLYIVHGLLHLLGYDDIQPKDRVRMRKKERYYMKQLTLGKSSHDS